MNDRTYFPFDIENLLGKIEDCKKIMVLGGMDTGKTTLIRTLHDRLGGLVIDGDLGQPEIGPPGLISLGTYEKGMEDAYFVGSFTPRGNLVQVMAGFTKLATGNKKRCFIDTDGWIDGEAARVYKGELIGLVEPDVLLLLQQEDELIRFTTYLSGDKTITLKAQKREKKTRGERSANRIRKFKYYFSRSRRIEKTWKQVIIAGTLLGQGERIPSDQLEEFVRGEITAGWKYENTLSVLSSSPPDSRTELKSKLGLNRIDHYSTDELKYRLVGCYSDRNFVSEGPITEIKPGGIEILATSEKFNLVKIGKERVKPSGRNLK